MIQGAIGPVIGAVVGTILTLVVTQPEKVDLWLILRTAIVLSVLVFIVCSLCFRRLRTLVWGNLWRLLKWVGGLRVKTRRGRDQLFEDGYAKRSSEVEDERKLSPRPTWRVTHNPGDDWIYIHNSGYAVDDVVVSADPELFEFAEGAERGFIKGRLGDNTSGGSSGKQVAGTVTRKGEREGVTFTFSWKDQHGDTQPPSGFHDMPVTATLPPRTLLPVVEPTWQIGRPKGESDPDIYALVNGEPGFVATNVRIDASPQEFTFMVSKRLGDLSGVGGFKFGGRPEESGRILGVNFYVTYDDVNGDEHTDHVPKRFDRGWGF